jgi:hypothetical protein
MAWRIRHIDPEIAAFRCIHAEEEAAAALFHALVFKKYSGASRLGWKNHRHKAALQPYFDVVVQALRSTTYNATFTMSWRPDIPGHGFLLGVTTESATGDKQHYTVLEPLSFSTRADGTEEHFAPHFESLASRANAESVRHFISELTVERNRALYATHRGIPKYVGNIDECILARRDRVFRVLAIFVLVIFEREPQAFVQQALQSFLEVLGLLGDASC